MSLRNKLCLVFSIISIILLVPGLIQPILSLRIGAEIPFLGEINLHESKRSILGTVEDLYQNNNFIVAFLILFFSVIVPITKGVLILYSLFSKSLNRRRSISYFLGIIGKWSMADVFVVGLFIAYLSTSTDSTIHAGLHSGFYYFLSYCILSIAAFQLFENRLES